MFLQGLRELGYVAGQNLVLARRDMEGRLDRLPALAAELVQLPVEVIVTTGGVPATRAAMQATTTIPIVMAEVGEPVETGLVASLARPGGNVTGLSSGGPIAGKRLQLLKEAAPGVARVAVLYHTPFATSLLNLREAQAAAPDLGLIVPQMEVSTTPGVVVGKQATSLPSASSMSSIACLTTWPGAPTRSARRNAFA